MSALTVHAGQDWVRRSAHPEKARHGRLALNYRVFESFIGNAAQEWQPAPAGLTAISRNLVLY